MNRTSRLRSWSGARSILSGFPLDRPRPRPRTRSRPTPAARRSRLRRSLLVADDGQVAHAPGAGRCLDAWMQSAADRAGTSRSRLGQGSRNQHMRRSVPARSRDPARGPTSRARRRSRLRFRHAAISLSAVVLLGLFPAEAPAQLGTVHPSPVIARDLPDPTVIRARGGYWASGTSTRATPIFPIFHSADLLTWSPVGAVFTAAPAWSAGSYWAPELYRERGRYRVYYTARRAGGPLCVAVATARRPAGPYRDRGPIVCQAAGSIDPFPVKDERGRLFLVWKEDGNSRGRPTRLLAQRLSRDGLRLRGRRSEILRNESAWEGGVVEGPAVVRRRGWFYLFYSGNTCCDATCRYAMGVARARSLLGPWRRNPRNPILAADGDWRCPGHGSVVTDRAGRDFMLYHAYRASSPAAGRQVLLARVRWGSRWPSMHSARR